VIQSAVRLAGAWLHQRRIQLQPSCWWWVLARAGVIHQKQPGFTGEAAGDGQTLLLAAA